MSGIDQFKNLVRQNMGSSDGKFVVTFRNLMSCLRLKFEIKQEHSNFIRVLDPQLMKILQRSDHHIFSLSPEVLGDPTKLQSLMDNIIIIQVAKTDIFSLDDLNLKE